MTVRLFPRRRVEAAPSTQFAATVFAPPEADSPAPSRTDAAGPDSGSPDSLVNTDACRANAAVPDVLTDLGGLLGEAPDPAQSPTLSHIGRYALKRVLGAGGLGSVYEAWDPLLSRMVAVKTLQFDMEHDARISLDGLFLNEARAAAGLNHRYIVTIHDAGLSPQGVYIAMERLYGRDLQQALASGWRPTVDQAVQLVRRIGEALAYAHARGVVHCDIKPANIFLQRRDRPKVLDFGIARIVHGAAQPALDGAMAGSPRYRSPEQLTGSGVDARTDLFSLGVVMYELLTGRRAFDGDSLAQINDAVLNQSPAPAHALDPKVPVEISAIASRLMARAPAERYACAPDLLADLRRWIHAHPDRPDVAAAECPGPAVAPPPRRRWTAARALLAATVMGAAAAVAAGLMTPQGPPAPPPTARPAAPGSPDAPGSIKPATPARSLPTASTIDAPATPAVAGSSAAPAVLLADARPAGPGPARPRPARAADTRLPHRPGEALAASVVSAAAPRADATGLLQFAVSPWGAVEVDGKPAGTTPPLVRLSLPEGSHTITVRNADFVPYTVQVQIVADRPVTLRHRFGS